MQTPVEFCYSPREEIDMRRAIAEVAVIVAIFSVSVAAQWPKYQAPGVPRDAERRVRMDAPTPRMPDGKPDLSGNWVRVRGEGAFAPPELAGTPNRKKGMAGSVAASRHQLYGPDHTIGRRYHRKRAASVR